MRSCQLVTLKLRSFKISISPVLFMKCRTCGTLRSNPRPRTNDGQSENRVPRCPGFIFCLQCEAKLTTNSGDQIGMSYSRLSLPLPLLWIRTLSILLNNNGFQLKSHRGKTVCLLTLLPSVLHFYSFSSACQPFVSLLHFCLDAGCFGFPLDFSMSGSSNDHVLRDGARPDEMDDIFSTLSLRQLNVLYGVLTNNSCRMVFMDRLQDIRCCKG